MSQKTAIVTESASGIGLGMAEALAASGMNIMLNGFGDAFVIDDVRDVLLAAQPAKRFVTVEETGALAVFLCTDAAASITGDSLSTGGGWTAQ